MTKAPVRHRKPSSQTDKKKRLLATSYAYVKFVIGATVLLVTLLHLVDLK